MAMTAADMWRARSRRGNASGIWRGGDDVFSRTSRDRDDMDDEETLKWAALNCPLTSESARGFSTGLTEKFDKMQVAKVEKPVPNSFFLKRNIKIEHSMRNVEKFPLLFPKETKEEESEKITIASLFEEPETQILPIYEPLEHRQPLEHRYNRYSAPDIEGKGKMPEAHTFFPDSHREWNIDNMSVGQIRQMIDIMYTEYKLMCLRGKSEVDACKTIIQCFTGTLLRWWEAESSPKLIETMEAEVLKDEKGDVIHNLRV